MIAAERLTFIETGSAVQDDFARAVKNGLEGERKRLPCRYLYDANGSELFEAICETPEYYLSRAESEILGAHAAELAARFPSGAGLVELGSGSSRKTRLLVEALLARHGQLHYWPIDISPSMLQKSARALLTDYPGLTVTAVAAEYRAGLRALDGHSGGARLVLWLGSNLGNFDRSEAARFLQRLRAGMRPEDRLLVGIDLRKERSMLERAYDDSRGATARFNLNLLERINRELDGDFDLEHFRHRAVYKDEAGHVELSLVSTRAQTVAVAAIDLEIHFCEGESIETERSYKYSPDEIHALARTGGFALEQQWLDAQSRFSLNLLAPLNA